MKQTTKKKTLDDELKHPDLIVDEKEYYYPVGEQYLPDSIGGGSFMLYNGFYHKSTITLASIYNKKMSLLELANYNKISYDKNLIEEV